VFNPVNAPELTLAIGRVLHEAADQSRPHDDYRRSQLLSAYSIARHLAAEQSAGPELRGWFRSAIAEVAEVDVSADSAAIGAALCDHLAELRKRGDSDADRARGRIQGLLRELSDREVAALANPPK